ncbi:MAG: DUF4215 domain-containing protein [Candidatus Nanoarchaeia archaeon]
MKNKFLFAFAFLTFLAIADTALAYNVNVTINSNIMGFNTDVYKCLSSECSSVNFYDEVNSGTSKNIYNLIGSGSEYYAEYDYKECMVPHVYRNHVWDPYTNTKSYSIILSKKTQCKGTIAQGSLSDSEIYLGESVIIDSDVESAFKYSLDIPATMVIPDNLKDDYSSKVKIGFYANDILIYEEEREILIDSEENFEFNWTPASLGTYEIKVKTQVTDCACLSQTPQEKIIGTLEVIEAPECTKNSDCGSDYFNKYCSNNDVFKENHNFLCIDNKCTENIFSSFFEDCSEDYCEDWKNYCVGASVWEKRTCFEKGCLLGNCFSDPNLEKNFIEDCEYGCFNGDCLPQCTKDSDCGGESYSEEYCVGKNVVINHTMPECIDNSCSSKTIPETIEICDYRCENGECKEPVCGDGNKEGNEECDDGNIINGDGCSSECKTETAVCFKNSDCGINGWLGEESCVCTKNLWDFWITNICENPGEYDAYCSTTSEWKLKQACGEDYCEAYGNNYCKNNNVYHLRTCYDNGCLNASCFSNSYSEESIVEDCSYGCINGECKEPVCGDGIKQGSEECDDGNLNNYDGCSSECKNEKITCTQDSDCGINQFFGNKICINDDVFKMFNVYSCVNPGQYNSFCEVNEEFKLIEDCKEDTCKEWEYYCSTNKLMKKRICYDNGCCAGNCFTNLNQETSLVQVCENGCANAKCLGECTTKPDCGSESYSENYCLANNVVRDHIIPSCLKDTCNFDNKQVETLETCSYGCFNGSCKSDVCGNGIKSEDEDCDDGNDANNDGCSSECKTEKITCTQDSDCGIDSWLNQKSCSSLNNQIIDNFKEYECINKGTMQSYCNYTITQLVKQNCTNGCLNGVCIPCTNCTTTCKNNYYGDKYCSQNNVYRDLYEYTLLNGKCTEKITRELYEECDEECDDGKCVEDNGGSSGGSGGSSGSSSSRIKVTDKSQYDEPIIATYYSSGALASSVGIQNLSSEEPAKVDTKSTTYPAYAFVLLGLFLIILIVLIVALAIRK